VEVKSDATIAFCQDKISFTADDGLKIEIPLNILKTVKVNSISFFFFCRIVSHIVVPEYVPQVGAENETDVIAFKPTTALSFSRLRCNPEEAGTRSEASEPLTILPSLADSAISDTVCAAKTKRYVTFWSNHKMAVAPARAFFTTLDHPPNFKVMRLVYHNTHHTRFFSHNIAIYSSLSLSHDCCSDMALCTQFYRPVISNDAGRHYNTRSSAATVSRHPPRSEESSPVIISVHLCSLSYTRCLWNNNTIH
jgi:hypothetical protein